MRFLLPNSVVLILALVMSACNGVQESQVTENFIGSTETSSLAIDPPFTSIYVNQTQQFSASGGVEPYAFSIVSGGGSLDGSNLYTAPATRDTVTVRVTDASGATSDALVLVNVQLAISPTTLNLNTSSTYQFSASGGTLPYAYSIVSGASTVNASSGLMTGAATPETAIVRVTDGAGVTANATVYVGNGPVLNTTAHSLPVNETYQFTVSSGTAPYSWAVVSGGGSINAVGLFTAGASSSTTIIRVTDANGYYHQATLTVFKKHIISAGLDHTCITHGTTNVLRCWGANLYGSTGNGLFYVGVDAATMGDNLKSVKFPSNVTAEPVSFSMGEQHGCALFDDGETRCWGYGGYGQNGYGGVVTGTYAGIGEQILPVPVDPSNQVVALDEEGEAHNFTCVILNDGSVKCFGVNNYGQLGQDNGVWYGQNTTSNSVYSMPAINLGQAALQVETGGDHACAVLADRSIKCWGWNGYGQLGLGDTTNRGTAANPMTGLSAHVFPQEVLDISLGVYHTCVLTRSAPAATSGEVRCWGYSGYGEVGINTNDGYYGNDPGETATALAPLNLGLGAGVYVKKIDSSYHSVCALTTTNQVKCWGYGGTGTLGQEDSVSRADVSALPYVYLGTGRTAVDITLGGHTACALLDNGEVKCWGNNSTGSLGAGIPRATNIGDNAGEMGDSLVAVNLGTNVTAVHQIKSSYKGVCALVTDSGRKTIKCWGSNESGALGIENYSMGDEPSELGTNAPAVNLGTSKTIAALPYGAYTSCALFTDGTAKCWGTNAYYNRILGTNQAIEYVGVASNQELGTSLPYFTTGGEVITKMESSRSGANFVCLILNGTYVKCIGRGNEGMLGQGNTTNYTTLGSISAINIGAGRTPVDIAAAANSACVALDDGSVKCWGWNGSGQMGQGNNTQQNSPVTVSLGLGAGEKVVKLAAGWEHYCAQTNQGNLKCWGAGTDGQLGHASATNKGDNAGEMGASLPYTYVETGATVTKVGAGNGYTCALTSDKKVKCWGINSWGNLGLGTTASVFSPTGSPYIDFGTGRTVLDLSVGDYHACVLLDNNQVKCWGGNEFGQLAQGNIKRLGDNQLEMGNYLLPITVD